MGRNNDHIRNQWNRKEKQEKIDENKSWPFEKIGKIDKILFGCTLPKGEKTQITNIRNESSISLPILLKVKEAMPTNWTI